jgi:hypothetical protein
MPDAPQQIDPEQDMKPLMDEIDRLLAETGGIPGAAPGEMPPGPGAGPIPSGMPPAPEGPPTEAPVEEMMVEEAPAEAPAEGGMAELADMLGIDEARAQALYDASQQLGQLEGKSPAEVGQMMLEDFQLRMQVEKIAGGLEDEAAAEPEPEIDTELVEEVEE